MQYLVLSNVNHDGVTTYAGESIELDAAAAAPLLEVRAIDCCCAWCAGRYQQPNELISIK
jgi:hypothetical protein